MKLLIAYDGSESSKEAVYDLRRAALPARCEALVLTVADVPVIPEEALVSVDYAYTFRNAYEESQAAAKYAENTASQGVALIQELFPHWDVDADSCMESPSVALKRKAQEWKPDLLVVGSHSHAPWGRFLFGSVSMSALNSVDCDVRIARGKIEDILVPVRVIVGIDGSAAAHAAAEAMLSRDWPKDSAVHFVTAVDSRLIASIIERGGPLSRWLRPDDPEPLAWVYRMLHHFEEKARQRGLIASTIMRQDDPKDVLLNEAARWGADCIFVGSRGLGLGERLVLGSVSTAVAARAHCSVEVVKSRADR